MMYTYLLINLFTIIIPFIFSFHPKILFYKQWGRLFPAIVIAAIIFIAWDAYFTSLGVWSFNERYVTGIQLLNLPMEEVLFFICIPYACVFTYYCLDKFYNLSLERKTANIITVIFISLLLLLGTINLHKLYTSVTFISTAVLCILLQWGTKVKWLDKAFIVYGILLLPFFIVNVLLTGTGLDEPVVSYNDAENLGVRILTIPVEDSVYGFELFILNLFFFHGFNRASAKH